MSRFVEVKPQVNAQVNPEVNDKLDGARVYLLRSEGKTWHEIQVITGAKSEAATRAASDAYAKMKELHILT